MWGGRWKFQPESAAAWAAAIFRNDSEICAVRSLRLSVQFARVNRFIYLFRCLIHSLVEHCINDWPEMNRFRKLFKFVKIDFKVTNRGIDSFMNCSNRQRSGNFALAKTPVFP